MAEEVHNREVKLSYHCSEKPGGGNSSVLPDENDIGTSTSIGPIKKTTNKML